MDSFYKVQLTGNKVHYFRELTLDEYKNLQKICVDETSDVFKKYIGEFLNELSVDGDTSDFNTVDILLACLYIRYYSISDVKNMISYFNGQQGKKRIQIFDIIENVESVVNSINQIQRISLNNFIAEEVEIDLYDFKNPIKGFLVDGKLNKYDKAMESLIPASIYNRIREYVDELLVDFNNINLFDLTQKDGGKVILNLLNDEDHIYTVIKVMLRDDLASLYRNLYDIKTKLHIGFNELKYITYSEYEIYITQYNEEQNSREFEMKKNSNEYSPNMT